MITALLILASLATAALGWLGYQSIDVVIELRRRNDLLEEQNDIFRRLDQQDELGSSTE